MKWIVNVLEKFHKEKTKPEIDKVKGVIQQLDRSNGSLKVEMDKIKATLASIDKSVSKKTSVF